MIGCVSQSMASMFASDWVDVHAHATTLLKYATNHILEQLELLIKTQLVQYYFLTLGMSFSMSIC